MFCDDRFGWTFGCSGAIGGVVRNSEDRGPVAGSPVYFAVPFPAPISGGFLASYRNEGYQRPFAKISLRIDAKRTCHIVGSGLLFVRISDGYVDYGRAKFEISYVRPGVNDRSKLNVNSHDVLQCSVDQR